jgi:hypothetical protein
MSDTPAPELMCYRSGTLHGPHRWDFTAGQRQCPGVQAATPDDDLTRDTANVRADTILSLTGRLRAAEAERDALAMRLARVKELLAYGRSENGGLPGSRIWLDDLHTILRGTP